MTTVYLLGRISKIAVDRLVDAGLTVKSVTNATTFDEVDAADYADIAGLIVQNIEPLDPRFITELPNLKVIARHGVGYDNIPLDLAREHNVWVTNTPGANARAVAESGFLFTLALLRQFRDNLQTSVTPPKVQVGHYLAGKTVGIIGWGDIAQQYGHFVHAFGAEVIYWNRSEKPSDFATQVTDLEDVLRRADVLSLTVPDTPETHGMLSAERFALLKPSAILINTARGGLVDTAAMIEALANDRLAGAGLDVVDADDDQLTWLTAQHNVLITNHIAIQTIETLEDMGNAAVDNVLAALKDGQPLNPVQ